MDDCIGAGFCSVADFDASLERLKVDHPFVATIVGVAVFIVGFLSNMAWSKSNYVMVQDCKAIREICSRNCDKTEESYRERVVRIESSLAEIQRTQNLQYGMLKEMGARLNVRHSDE
jgi:hypothetical protein